MKGWPAKGAFLTVALLLALALREGPARPQPAEGDPGGPWHTIARVSVDSNGTQAYGPSCWFSWFGSECLSISGDGRFVAFESWASNLVPNDTTLCERSFVHNCPDIFVHDRLTRQTTRVSVASDGTQANDESCCPSISADGRLVAFMSWASNLVPGDTNAFCMNWIPQIVNCPDIFVHDRLTGQTTRVSVASDGTQANGGSNNPSISADGRFVAFESSASNLVPGDTNIGEDVFVHDRLTGQTTRVSVASDGTQANGGISLFPSISADGRFVAFVSWARNLVPSDTNGRADVFVHDRLTGQTTRVSVASDGTQGNDDSGRVGWATLTAKGLSISGDGRFVAFESWASNLVPNDINTVPDVFVHDRLTGQTTRVSVSSTGAEAYRRSYSPSISADGRFVAFPSEASNLAPGGALPDIFVHDRLTGQTSRVSVSLTGTWADINACEPYSPFTYVCTRPSISADSRFVAFGSLASNLVPGDTNGALDIFVAFGWQGPAFIGPPVREPPGPRPIGPRGW